MTAEEIKELGFEDLEKRSAEIAEETASADAEKLEELNTELDQIEERRNALNIEIEERKAASEAVADGAGKEIEERKENKMTLKEVRNSKEYIDAYAKYIKTGKDLECRKLLTENVDGTANDGHVPTPEFVENRIRQAWENDKIFSRFTKTYVPGNLKVGFEASATDAVYHEEGSAAPDEEKLILGVTNLVPGMIKKWITVSDEVMALGSEEFLAYVYDEIAYKIIQFAGATMLSRIMSAPTTTDASGIGVPEVEAATVDTAAIIDAIALLGDGAQNPVFIANGKTIADIKKAALTAGYAYDPFAGLEAIQSSAMSDGEAIVGDLSAIQANLPEGDSVKFKFDDLSLAEKDLVKIVGRLYVAEAIVVPNMIARIVPES